MQILHKYELISLSLSCRESPGPFFGHLVVFFSVRDILRCNAANEWVRLNQHIKDYRISLILLEFRSVTFYDLFEDRLINDANFYTSSFMHKTNTLDSIFTSVCSVTDHRRCHNVVRTSATHLPNCPFVFTIFWHLWSTTDYIITQVILGFWLVLAYDLLEDRRIDDDSTRFKFFWIFWIFNLNQIQFFAKHSNQSVRFILYKH